jgi:hypothetical protein
VASKVSRNCGCVRCHSLLRLARGASTVRSPTLQRGVRNGTQFVPPWNGGRNPRAEARGYRCAAAPQPITSLSCRGQPDTIESSTDDKLQQLLFVGPVSYGMAPTSRGAGDGERDWQCGENRIEGYGGLDGFRLQWHSGLCGRAVCSGRLRNPIDSPRPIFVIIVTFCFIPFGGKCGSAGASPSLQVRGTAIAV